MAINSGFIGKKVPVSILGTSGISDSFDVFNSRKTNSWPVVKKYSSLSFNSGIIYENTSQDIVLTTEGVITDTTLFWTINHITTTNADFYGSIVSGSFTQQSTTNTGTFNIKTAFTGNTGKTSKTFQIQIRTEGIGGPVVYTSGTYTIPAITVSSLYWSPSTINENSTSYLYLQLGNCGSSYMYAFSLANSGTITSNDVSGGLITLTDRNPGQLTAGPAYQFLSDITTEGSETLTVQLSYGGYNIGSPQTLTVSDTSPLPIGTITPSTTTIVENNSVTFTCTISDPNYSGSLYYTVNNVTGTMSASDFTDGLLAGNFSVSGGNGSFSKKLVAEGVPEEEAFSVSLRAYSTSGPILATTNTITVTDADPPTEQYTGDIITLTGSNVTTSPGLCNIYYRRSIIAFVYTAAELQAQLGTGTKNIKGLRFYVTNQPVNQPLPTYAIGIKSGTFSGNPGNTGFTIVYPQSSVSFTTNAYSEFLFSTPFSWTSGKDLAFVFAWGMCPTGWNQSGTSYIGSGTSYYSWQDGSGSYVINTDTLNSTIAYRPVLQLLYSLT